MTSAAELPSLRLDASREEALRRAASIVDEAWRSFDQARPGQPEIDERLGELLRAGLPEGPSSVLDALDDAHAAGLDDEAVTALFSIARRERVEGGAA